MSCLQTALANNGTGAIGAQQIRDLLVSTFLPAGTIFPYAGYSSTIPSGYLLCNGGSYSNSTYPTLSTALSFTTTVTQSSNASITAVNSTTIKNMFLGMPLSGAGIAATVAFTATITSGSSGMTAISVAGSTLKAGMCVYGPGLPHGVYISVPSGSAGTATATLNKYNYVGIISGSVNSQPTTTTNQFYATSTNTVQTYTAVPAISAYLWTTSFTISNNATQSASGVTLTFVPYGGDGSTFFLVPDMRGRVPYGAGQPIYNGQSGIAGNYPTNIQTGLINDALVANLQNITIDTVAGGGDYVVIDQLGSYYTATQPAFLGVNWIIKT